MKVLVIGGTGLIGSHIGELLKESKHQVIIAGHENGDVQVDLTSSTSIENMFQKVSDLDAVVSAPAANSAFAPLENLKRIDYEKSCGIKLFGQMDLVLIGQKYLKDKGSFTLTSGILNHSFIASGSCNSMLNSAIEGFVKCAALELKRSLRLNVVSPTVILEAMGKYGPFFKGFEPIPAAKAALAYLKSVEGIINGQVITAWS